MGNWTTRERQDDNKLDPSSSYTLDKPEEYVQEIPLVHSHPVLSMCAADSTHIFTGSNDNSLLVYQWTCHVVKKTFKLQSKPATRIVYNRNKQLAYAASRDGNIYGWRWPSVEENHLVTMKDHTLSVTGLATNNDDLLVSGSRDNNVKVWDLWSNTCVRSVHIPRNLVTDMKWIERQNCILQSSEDKSLRIWDARTCSVIHQLPTKQHIQLCCAVSDCGNYFASGSSGQQGSGSEVTLWDRRNITNSNGGYVCEYRGHSGSVNSCMFLSPDNTNMIASCSNDSTVRIWNRDTGTCLLSEYMSGDGPVVELASPTSSLLACCTFNKGVTVWGLQRTPSNEYMLNLRAKY